MLGRGRVPGRLRRSPRACSPASASLVLMVLLAHHLPAPGPGRRGRALLTAGAGLRAHPPAVVAEHNEPSGACSSPGSRATSRPSPGSSSGARSAGSSNAVLIVGTLVVMAIYSWQLTLVTVVAFLPGDPDPALPAAPPARGLRPGAHRASATCSPRSPSRSPAPPSSAPTAWRTAPAAACTSAVHDQYRAAPRGRPLLRGDVPARRPVRRARARGRRRGVGVRRRRDGARPRHRRGLPVPDQPAALPDRRAERDPRPDPDRDRRVAARCSTCSTPRST